MAALFVTLVFIASILGLVGWIWIVVLAFSEGETLWGVGCFCFAPLCFVYGILNFDECKVPLILLAAGTLTRIILAAATVATAVNNGSMVP